MTPQEMNLKIAEILGIDAEITGTEKVCTVFITTNGKRHPAYAIDYTTDKALCWDLMERLLQAGWFPQQISYGRPPVLVAKDGHIVKNDSLLLATCEAFIVEFGK